MRYLDVLILLCHAGLDPASSSFLYPDGSSNMFAFTGIIAFVAFVVLSSTQIDTSGRGWKALYHQGVIDKREYYENRFKIL
jgi:hypothetical protein